MITQENERISCAANRLMDIYDYEDAEPRKGTKLHTQWEEKLLLMYKSYNDYIGYQCFITKKIEN